MNRATFICGALLSLMLFTGCSETLPLGTATKYPSYSNAVIVGAVVRDRVTGHYAALDQGFPVKVAAFNGVREPLSQTIEEEELQEYITLNARRIARREEIKEEMAQIVADRAPKSISLNPYFAQRPYMGTQHGIPPQ